MFNTSFFCWMLMSIVLTGNLFSCQSKPVSQPIHQPRVVGAIAFRGDEITQALPPMAYSRAYTLTSIGYEQITINGVLLNGEVSARIADFDGKKYSPSEKRFPVTLEQGQSITLFQSNPEIVDYAKELRYVLLETNRGTLRHGHQDKRE